jgi:hypothetical protein
MKDQFLERRAPLREILSQERAHIPSALSGCTETSY